MRNLLFLPAVILFSSFSWGQIEIRIDYTYDTNNFFDTQEKRDAIEAVAQFYGDILQDTLLRIDPADFNQASWSARTTHPSTGNTVSIPGLVVPENVIIVYVGSRNLGGSTVGRGGPGGFSASGFDDWFARIEGRGSAGAAAEPKSERTDFALWGGSLSFDTPRTWNFSQNSNQAGTEFISVALHEMGHVLGVGTADTWDNFLSDGVFTGPAVERSVGSAPSADSGHFLGDLTSGLFGSFNTIHGTIRPAMMLPSIIDNGSNFDVATDLDLAALVDIGWNLKPEVILEAPSLDADQVILRWNAVTFKQYQLMRSTGLPGFGSDSAMIDGEGGIQFWTDPSPVEDKAFYKLLSSDFEIAQNLSLATELTEQVEPEHDIYRSKVVEPREVECQFGESTD